VQLIKSDFSAIHAPLLWEHKGTFFLPDVPALVSLTDSRNTREVHLQNLGIFPSDEPVDSLLLDGIQLDAETYYAPDFLKKSKIPLFYSGDGKSALISRQGIAACRYIYSLWEKNYFSEAPFFSLEEQDILSGFLVIHSFAGGTR